jgi:hypothetical protein
VNGDAKDRDPAYEELGARLGEPVELYSLALPVGGWKPTMFGALMRALKGGGEPGAIKLGPHNMIVLTSTRIACFTAEFVSKRGLVPKQQLADWPRGDIEGSASRFESTTATLYADGDVGPNNTAKLVRLTLRAGTQAIQADLADDAGTRALLEALAVDPT